ncbi:hypothetical protein TNCT_217721 [Trichonephila clavata]|uniref:Uncharacterized protein n=1 Tax=Trichonephila clavata TaxID=2740835 RepID=A0A8X6KWL5_TRICU|nr:hypothetical protein TNCT_217721 [Trichonephila clavata]
MPPRKLTDEGEKQIHDFYNRDDISRQTPNIKDNKTVKSHVGVKLRIQKRTMIKNIREAFEIFKETNPETFKVIGLQWRFGTSYKLQKEIPYTPVSAPSVSNQSKSFMPIKKRLRVSDVYNYSDSDSDNESMNEESPPKFHQASKSPAEACRKTVRLMVLSVPLS